MFCEINQFRHIRSEDGFYFTHATNGTYLLSSVVVSLVSDRAETYQMIDQCDPTIATWSTAGDSFIIKDVDAFGKVRVLSKRFLFQFVGWTIPLPMVLPLTVGTRSSHHIPHD